jgi:hypothetical protein
MIDLYCASTLNGDKACCILQALELDYTSHFVNVG